MPGTSVPVLSTRPREAPRITGAELGTTNPLVPFLGEGEPLRCRRIVGQVAALISTGRGSAPIDAATFGRTVEIVLRDPAVDAVVVPVLRTAVSDPITVLRGVTMQPMPDGEREFLAGVLNDPDLGPMIPFGLDGTETDLIAARRQRILPLTTRDAEEMLYEIRSAPQLFGPLSGDRLNPEPVIDVLLRTARIAELLPESRDRPQPDCPDRTGVQIPDARIRLEPREVGDPLIRRLRL